MVTEFGLSPKLGTLNLSTESGYQKGYSQQTNRMIDQEIHRIVSERYASCKAILLENKEKIEQLAEELLDKETLSLPDIVDILGPRPYPIKESVIEYMQELRARKD
jgi:ATP-dependent Zn protease|mmetsp:Transcript_46932/g.62111  ORF Transcript_46932/g.62111 Transcript_46932/m.62111 type:complete len:106 (-) Transcript_46932:469-786(-)